MLYSGKIFVKHLFLEPQKADYLPNEGTCSSRRGKKTKHLNCALVVIWLHLARYSRDELRKELSNFQEVKGKDSKHLRCAIKNVQIYKN